MASGFLGGSVVGGLANCDLPCMRGRGMRIHMALVAQFGAVSPYVLELMQREGWFAEKWVAA